jgi:hypothetical protein
LFDDNTNDPPAAMAPPTASFLRASRRSMTGCVGESGL